jgi:hypothetical protein
MMCIEPRRFDVASGSASILKPKVLIKLLCSEIGAGRIQMELTIILGT